MRLGSAAKMMISKLENKSKANVNIENNYFI